jgi:2-polyprenyl-3-methyl-5-hydroxy-6-metoxy-1,4-benzoquinol methylase
MVDSRDITVVVYIQGRDTWAGLEAVTVRLTREDYVVMNTSFRYKCGCENMLHEDTGALKCLIKCEKHSDDLLKQPQGHAYYRSLGAVDAVGAPANIARYIGELVEALEDSGELSKIPVGQCLEIGCGASPYVPWLREKGMNYFGIDPDLWAVSWMRSTYDVEVARLCFEDLQDPGIRYHLVLAAHCFEHMSDAPNMIKKAASLLRPGGKLLIIIPNDSDPTNPDHQWFFNIESLARTMTLSGLRQDDLVIVERQIVKHEKFMYAIGTKP